MSKGVFGSPRMRGQSEIIESAAISGDMPKTGVAVSLVGGNEQLTVAAFDGASFAGISVANDYNVKQKTVSVTKAGLDIPVQVADGQTLEVGDEVGISSAGEIVKSGDAGEVYAINAVVRETGVTGVYFDNTTRTTVEVPDMVSIDMGMGGSSVGV